MTHATSFAGVTVTVAGSSLQAAQAGALSSRRRPVLRLHLTDRAAGLDALLGAARG